VRRFAVSAVTGGAALAGYVVIAAVLLRYDRVMVRLIREENAAERRYTASVVDGAGNISTVLTLGLHEAIRANVHARFLEVSKPLKKNIVVNEAKWGSIDLLNNAIRVGLVALYGWLAWRSTGTVLVGTAVMVHQYAQQIGNVIGSMATYWGELVRHGTDIAGADEILDGTPRSVGLPSEGGDDELARVPATLPDPVDRYWMVVYTLVAEVPSTIANWRVLPFIGVVQAAFQIVDADMELAVVDALTFPASLPRPD